MLLKLSDGTVIAKPSDEMIDAALAGAGAAPGTWVSLSRQDCSFLRAAAEGGRRFRLEFYDVRTDEFGRSDTSLSLARASVALRQYSAGSDVWQDEFAWETPRELAASPGPDGTHADFAAVREAVRRRQFRRTRRNRALTLAILANAAGALYLAVERLAWNRYEAIVLFTIAGAVMLAAVGFHRISWRCPSCGRYLGLLPGDSCPHCDFRLR